MLRKFALAEQMEDAAERIYRQLADAFRGDRKGAVLFEKLADEEHQHMLRVRMMRARFVRKDTALTSVHLDMPAAEAVIARAERTCEQIAKNPPRTLEEARALAIALEDEMAAAHAEMLTRDCPPDLRSFLESLAAQDRHHVALLKSAR